MAIVQVGNGVQVNAPAGVAVVPMAGSGQAGFTGAAPAAPKMEASSLGGGLSGAGFQLAAEFVLRPANGVAFAAAAAEATKVAVDITKNESALLLIESEDGVFAWSYPDSHVKKPAGLGFAEVHETLIFTLAPNAAHAGSTALSFKDVTGSKVWDWVVKKAIGGLKAKVLKFVVGKIEDFAVGKIEGKTPQGLMSMASDKPFEWIPGAGLPALPAGKAAKILLMVHGTFSTTAGSFKDLTKTPEGMAFLKAARSHYDAVLGIDHKTLALSPEENAANLLAGLKSMGLAAGSTIDAVSYSRGGLVFRAFAEQLADAGLPGVTFGKAVFVGCTNGGTHLADPENWKNLVDLYTNIVMAGARAVAFLTGQAALNPVVSQVISTIGEFVQYFAVVGVEENHVPGLAGMRPSGSLVAKLNGASGGAAGGADYFVISSNFEAKFEKEKGITKELCQMLADAGIDQLFQHDNDLVVDTESMAKLGKRATQLKGQHPYGTTETIYHTNYFLQPQTAVQLKAWLGI